ncbi:MAG: segregation/condensation protein A [Erysipelotrichaceae bacterium]|nr:segregation/condensation protein A [Erysipelotrichaceae bacterium]
MNFEVRIDQFEGPLDLMLHLIREHQLNLFDLDISILSDQYLAYLNAMQDLHLEVASEYLVELSTLLEYKSRQILPKKEDEVEEEEDEKDKLVRRLIEYQQFKQMSEELSAMATLRNQRQGKPLSLEADEWMANNDNGPVEGSPYDLVKAMNRVMRRMQLNQPIATRYTKKELSMEERSLQIRSRLASLPKTFSFDTLLEDVGKDRDTVIVTFLAILDLCRLHTLYFSMDEKENIIFSKGSQA